MERMTRAAETVSPRVDRTPGRSSSILRSLAKVQTVTLGGTRDSFRMMNALPERVADHGASGHWHFEFSMPFEVSTRRRGSCSYELSAPA